MRQKKIICFGDSNTYGFDPRSFLGGRYEADSRWCDLLAERTGWEVVNCGENGRPVPHHSWERRVLEEILERNAPADLLCVMLGTNDVLMNCEEEADSITARMEAMLEGVRKVWTELPILLLSPPRLALPLLCRKVSELRECYRALAEKQHLFFCDAGGWDLPLACDGAHFSEEGHRIFAEQLLEFLESKGIMAGLNNRTTSKEK